MGAPAFVYDPDIAAEAYSAWSRPGFGRGCDPTDPTIRFYYLGSWLTCVRPQFLYAVGALTGQEWALLDADQYRRWGRPGRCPSRMLDSRAEVPDWLECCKVSDRGAA